MRKLILIAALLIAAQQAWAQNASMDLAVLTGGVAYQKFVHNPKMDNVLHFWGGYFATNALQTIVNKSDLPKWAKKTIPPFLTFCAVVAKENLDGKVSRSDMNAGLMGMTCSIIKFNINLTPNGRRKTH